MKRIISNVLESGILIAVISFIGYALATAFYLAPLHYHKIPYEFLSVSISNVIVFSVLLMGLIGIVLIISFLLLNIIPYNKYSYFHRCIDVTVYYIVAYTVMLLANPFSLNHVIRTIGAFVVVSALLWIMQVIKLNREYGTVEGFWNKVRLSEEITRITSEIDTMLKDISILNIDEYKYNENGALCKYKELLKAKQDKLAELRTQKLSIVDKSKNKYIDKIPSIITLGLASFALIISITLTTFFFGYESQRGRTNYLALATHPNFLLITTKDDTAILKEFVEGKFTDRLLFLPTDQLGEMITINTQGK